MKWGGRKLLIALEVRIPKWVPRGSNQGVRRAGFFWKLQGESDSSPFPASRVCLHPLACGPTSSPSWVALSCSRLKRGFSSWPEIEVWPWWWEHQILPAKPRISDKALTLRLCRKELPQSWKVVKQVSVFRRKKNTACVYRHASGLRELCHRGCLNHLYGAFLLGVLWAIILICLSWVHLWYISESSQVCTSISQLRWILPKRPVGS